MKSGTWGSGGACLQPRTAREDQRQRSGRVGQEKWEPVARKKSRLPRCATARYSSQLALMRSWYRNAHHQCSASHSASRETAEHCHTRCQYKISRSVRIG